MEVLFQKLREKLCKPHSSVSSLKRFSWEMRSNLRFHLTSLCCCWRFGMIACIILFCRCRGSGLPTCCQCLLFSLRQFMSNMEPPWRGIPQGCALGTMLFCNWFFLVDTLLKVRLKWPGSQSAALDVRDDCAQSMRYIEDNFDVAIVKTTRLEICPFVHIWPHGIIVFKLEVSESDSFSNYSWSEIRECCDWS